MGTSLVTKFAEKFGVESNKMMASLQATAFKQHDNKAITNEQMMALLVVANEYNLNPWTKEIFAFPSKGGGIVPIVGVDGWARIINENSNFNGMDFNSSPEVIEMPGAKKCPEWIECVMHRKDREHPVIVREYIDEVYKPSAKYPGPWQSHTKRMLRHKAMIQCARLAFGFSGVYDQDEGERIIEAEVIQSNDISLEDAIAKHIDTINLVKESIATNELDAAVEAWLELTGDEQSSLWVAVSKGGPFTTKERETMRGDEWVALRNNYYKDINNKEKEGELVQE